jgi:hypothetical protein
MTKYKQTFKKHRKYKIHTAVETNKTHVYRYMSYSTFIRCLSDKTFRFSEPSQWPDKFESRFYSAQYTSPKNKKIPHKVFAFCTTAVRDCEASWSIYASGEPTIQIKINRQEWLKLLNNWKADNKNFTIFEAPVNYDLQESHIANIHKPPMTGHHELFHKFDLYSYLSLLLLKRKAYSYEQEIRYFLVLQKNTEQNISNTYLDIAVFTTDIIEEIRFSPQLSVSNLSQILTIFKEDGWSIPLQPFKLENIIIEKNSKKIKLCAFDISEGTYADFSQPIII